MVTLEGKLVVRVPAGQQASHARPDSTVALEEPVTLLIIAYQRDSDDIASVSISLLQTAHFYAILLRNKLTLTLTNTEVVPLQPSIKMQKHHRCKVALLKNRVVL